MTNPAPKVITGPLHADNKGASDWGYQGLIAYGCFKYVVVIDPNTLQIVQTIGPNKDTVAHVRWSREKYHHAFATGSTYNLYLACADASGTISIWDVSTGHIRTECVDPQVSKPISCLEWYTGNEESHDLIICLRNAEALELWDGYSGVMLWRKYFGEGLMGFSLDPFDIERLVCLCECPRLLLVSDMSVTSEPRDNFGYLRFVDPSPIQPAPGTRRRFSSGNDKSGRRLSSSSSWSKMATLASNIILSGPESGNKRQSVSSEADDTDLLTSCVQAIFTPAHRHVVLLVFPGEIQMFDVDVELVLGTVRLDKASPSFTKVFPCSGVDMLLCLHDNGSTTVRVRKQAVIRSETIAKDMTYDLRCQSDPLRLLRQCKVFSIVCQPITERQMCLVLSDSRVIILDVMATFFTKASDQLRQVRNSFTLSDMTDGFSIMAPGTKCLGDQGKITLKIVTSGLVSGLVYPITAVAMAPSAADKNEAGPHLAVGSGVGTVQLVNVHSGQVEFEYKLYTSPVRGLIWVDAHRIVTYTYPDPPSYGNKVVHSEIVMLNTHSGIVSTLRDRKRKDGPIQMMRVSPSSTYLVTLVKNRPLELWNLRTMQLVREVPLDEVARLNDMAWYPYISLSLVKKQVTDEHGNVKEVEKKMFTEQLFLGAIHDLGCILRLTIVDGIVKELVHIKFEALFGAQVTKIEIMCLAWKSRYLVMAEKAGSIYVTDAKNAKTPARRIYDRHGFKVKCIKMAPGNTNFRFLVMYTDGIYIWEIGENATAEMIASSPSLQSDIVEVAWTGPETVALVTEDACVHVVNVSTKPPSSPTGYKDDEFVHVSAETIKIAPNPVSAWNVKDLFSPALLEPKLAFLLKYSLQCNIQPFCDAASQVTPLIRRDVYNHLVEPGSSTAHRCYVVARLFGDEFDLEFWGLVKYAVLLGRKDTTRLVDITTPFDLTDWLSKIVVPPAEASDLVDLCTSDRDPGTEEMDGSWVKEGGGAARVVSPLDVLISSHDYKVYERARLTLHNKRRATYRVGRLCSGRYIMTGDTDMAVQVLMETESDSPEFKADYFKACLASSVQANNTALSTVKLAATHLLAAGHLEDGVELLCLMDKRLDACKYLITYGRWKDAVWLAKTSLGEGECLQIMCKWCEHLWQNNQKSKAVLVMLSMGQYVTVLRMLWDLRRYDTAALFLQACTEHKLLPENARVLDEVYVEFAKLLAVTEYQSAVKHYCHLAGECGQTFLTDLNH